MTRAVMEGVVFSLKDSFEILGGLDVRVEQVRATGGGARSALWRELQADVYGVPIHRTSRPRSAKAFLSLVGSLAMLMGLANRRHDVQPVPGPASYRRQAL
jgi:xylulokinase